MWTLFTLALLLLTVAVAAQPSLNAAPLTEEGDLAAKMVAGIDRYLTDALEASAAQRDSIWRRGASSPEEYAARMERQRGRLRQALGVTELRDPPQLEFTGQFVDQALVTRLGSGAGYTIHAARWTVRAGVEAEGLLLLPEREIVADILALPDCDATPEQLVGLMQGVPKANQFARRLAESGCRVLIPTLINRSDAYSGLPGVRQTNLPHREVLWRAAYEMGRTLIGMELEKVLAGADWLTHTRPRGRGIPRPLGIIGYGEGGLLALYAAALNARFQATVVSGYVQPRERLWSEPIYRNVFGLLKEFGDAELLNLIAPRFVLIDACAHPNVPGPPQTPGRSGAAPGVLATPDRKAARREIERSAELRGEPFSPESVIFSKGGAGTEPVLRRFLAALLGAKSSQSAKRQKPPEPLAPDGGLPRATIYQRHRERAKETEARQKRQYEQLLEYTQRLMRESPLRRQEFWKQADASNLARWQETAQPYREKMHDDLIGRLPTPTLPLQPRARKVYETPKFTGYEVTLEVYPHVFAYGVLLVPKDIAPGERRAVVVCQHGLEGRPQEVADPAVDSPYYHRFACQLAEQGYVTFSPQNPYIGEDRFRVLLRKAQPLGLTLFSFIVRQHERILDWLETLPFVDPKRIAFYGLSYGGKTAMRIPALLERYCLSICSADYNEWVWKNAAADSPYSYLLTIEYDMPEWNLANTFNYAEMSWLICPRPFMVERGHDDGVAPDEWVAYEYARTRRRYVKLGIPDRTEIEFFDGPHTIHGVGTFAFLKKHLPPTAP